MPISDNKQKRILAPRFVALALALSMAGGILFDGSAALAFDPEKVFKQEKPSIGQLFRHYFKKRDEGEKVEALDVLKYAAEQGNPTAQWKLGQMYANGAGVKKSRTDAFHFFKQMADRYERVEPNTPDWAITGKAMVALGQYYAQGIPEAGVTADTNVARTMFTTAAMYFRDPEGQFELGRLLLDGSNGVEEGRQAMRMLELSRQKGHPGAMALLGNALIEGRFVAQDKIRGMVMLTEALQLAKGEMRHWVETMQAQAFAILGETERRQAMSQADSQSVTQTLTIFQD